MRVDIVVAEASRLAGPSDSFFLRGFRVVLTLSTASILLVFAPPICASFDSKRTARDAVSKCDGSAAGALCWDGEFADGGDERPCEEVSSARFALCGPADILSNNTTLTQNPQSRRCLVSSWCMKELCSKFLMMLYVDRCCYLIEKTTRTRQLIRAVVDVAVTSKRVATGEQHAAVGR